MVYLTCVHNYLTCIDIGIYLVVWRKWEKPSCTPFMYTCWQLFTVIVTLMWHKFIICHSTLCMLEYKHGGYLQLQTPTVHWGTCGWCWWYCTAACCALLYMHTSFQLGKIWEVFSPTLLMSAAFAKSNGLTCNRERLAHHFWCNYSRVGVSYWGLFRNVILPHFVFGVVWKVSERHLEAFYS